jgi:hypothetical protein
MRLRLGKHVMKHTISDQNLKVDQVWLDLLGQNEIIHAAQMNHGQSGWGGLGAQFIFD